MTTPYVAYSAAADQRDYVVPFPFLNRTHVKVTVNGVATPVFTWANSSTIRLSSAPAFQSFVEIHRETPVDEALVTFQDGAILPADDLNTAMTQLLYRQQELAALYERTVQSAKDRLAAANGIPVAVDDVFDTLVAELAENATVANFQQRIADIDLNATNILTQAQQITDQSAAIAAVDLRADTLDSTAASLQTQADGLQVELDNLTATVDALAGGDPGSGIATLIANEEAARIAGDQALVDTIALIGAKSGDNLSFIADLNSLKVGPGESFAQRFSALSSADAANAAAIATESTTRATEIAAEASRIDLLTTRVGTAESDIIAEQVARANGDSAEAAQRALLEARVTDTENDIAVNAAAIVTEQTARADGDAAEAAARSALAARVTTAEGDITTNAAAISAEEIARADGDAAEAAARAVLEARVTTAEGDIVTANAALVTEQNARAAGDTAIVSDLALLGAVNAGGTAFVLDQNTVQVAAGETLGTRLSAINTSLGNNSAAIATEESARIAADNAEATARGALAVRITEAENDIIDNAAAIVSESNARATDIAAEASARNSLAAVVNTKTRTFRQPTQPTAIAVGDHWYDTDDNNKLRVWTGTSWAITTDLRIESVEAAITTEQTVRANADSALASDLALLGASNGGGTAWILDENTVQVAGGVTLGTRLSGIDASIGDNAAAIVTEQNARVSADNALSSSITTLQTEVDGNTASVSTLSASVNGLEAKYGVTLDVNGYVTGFAQNNNGSSGSFVIVADEFKIVDPNGGGAQTPVVPFQITNGDVKINGNLVVDGSISSSQLANNSVTKGNSSYTDVALGLGTNTWTQVANATLNTDGGEVRVDFCCALDLLSSTSTTVLYRVKRGSTIVREGTLLLTSGSQLVNVEDSETFQIIGTANVPTYVSGSQSIFAVDTSPGSAANTYSIELKCSTFGATVRSRQLGLLETKR